MSKIKISIITLMSFILALSIGIFVVISSTSNKISLAEEFSLTNAEYKSIYELGETVEIKSAKFEYKGKEYNANSTIRYPNGISYRRNIIVLNDAGKYYIDYSAIADDNTLLKETKTFTVVSNVYSFEGEGEYNYGSNSYLESSVSGINVALGRESVFKINKSIDISNLTRFDSILKFYATPALKGAADVDKVYVRLTDVYDSNRYVELQYRPVGTFCYVSAVANDQYLIGLRQSGSPTVTEIDYNNYFFTLYQNNPKYGHVSRISLNGAIDSTNATNCKTKYFPDRDYTETEMFLYNALEIRMDYAEKRVYCQEESTYSIDRCICADFDDERSLGGKDPWAGFTTGEVFISVYASGYSASSFNFFITDICGHDVADTTIENKIAPVLSVDTQDYDVSNLPNAIVGKSYNLFDATAIDDIDGQVAVDKNVFFNYNNSTRSIVSVINNTFTPTREGVYTIEYSAKDSFGNKAVKTLNINSIRRDDGLSYTLSGGAVQFDAGEEVPVRQLTLNNASNIYSLKAYAKNLENDIEYQIDIDNLTFVPLYKGQYKVAYVYTDYCCEEEIPYTIQVVSSDLVVFEDNILLPKYIIKGMDYPVKPMYAYTFDPTTKRELSQLFIKENGGQEVPVTGNTYSVKNNVDSVQLIYKAGNKTKKYTIPVVDVAGTGVNTVNLAKYFYNGSGQFNTTGTKSKINFKVNNGTLTDGTAKLEVINPAYLINDFNIVFNCVTGETSFERVKVTFTSAYNSNKTITFEFSRDIGDNAKVNINSASYSAQSSISSKFATPVVDGDNFNITYNAPTKQFNIGGFVVNANQLMKNFDDFFYITFELVGITGDASIDITRVVNQKITNSQYDGVKPMAMYDDFKNYYLIGDDVKISKIKVYDFVDPNPSCTVTLKNSAGYLVSVDGVKLDGVENDFNNEYIVKVNGYDRMEFQIDCKDFSDHLYTVYTPIAIRDIFAPSITINVKNNVYKVGDTVTVADYTIMDDATAPNQIQVTYYIIAPDGSVTYLSNTSFAAAKEGIYRIYYIARDEAGNNAYANYLIKVE